MASIDDDIDHLIGSTVHHEGSASGPALPFHRGRGPTRTTSSALSILFGCGECFEQVATTFRPVLEEIEPSEGEAPESSPEALAGAVLGHGPVSDSPENPHPIGEREVGSGRLPPFVILDGKLFLEVDRVARLRFLHAALSLEHAANPTASDTLDRVAALLDRPVLHSSIPRLSAAHSELVSLAGANAPALEEEARMALLAQGELARCSVLGGRHVRARLLVGGEGYPCYLSEACVRELPLLTDLEVRILAERYPRLELHERVACSLRVRAIGSFAG